MKFVVRVWGSGVICLLLGQGSIATFSYAAVDLSAHAVKVEAVLSNLTLEQKVAQMIQAEIKYVTPDDIRHYGLGSVLNGGGSFPRGDKHATTEEWVSLADDFYYASIDRSEGNAGIPLIWGTDAVHGHNNVIGATLFPHNIGLGAARDPDLIYRIGVATAREVAATGIDWIFAPTVAVATDYRWGRTYESYSSDYQLVADYAEQIVRALQSEGTIATAKHFIGDGGTYRGIDQGDTRIGLDELLGVHGAAYLRALDAGVMSVMASFNSWNGEKIHGHKMLLTDVLKTKLGFEGFVISDWNGIGQVVNCSNDSCPQAINAGIDMLMAPEDWESLHSNMVQQVRAGEISHERINDAVRRILRVKFATGVMESTAPSRRISTIQGTKQHVIGAASHREIAREAVRKSLVLLKNNHNLLPLPRDINMVVAGSGADNIGKQSGGWTITWQGTGNDNSDFPNGVSIFEGLSQQIEPSGGTVFLAGSMPADVELNVERDVEPDVALVVYGEEPYAEGQGDLQSLAWQQGRKEDLALLKGYAERGIPVISLLLTGRPLWVNAEINASDAFVVAWLPGSEGAGVADLLLEPMAGEASYDFTGRLPFSWPAYDLNPTDHALPVKTSLFPRGYGLSLAEHVLTPEGFDELPVGEVASIDKPVFIGGTKSPWRFFIGDHQNWSQSVDSARSTSANGALIVKPIDYKVQEDALRLDWRWRSKGKTISQAFWQADSPVDFTPLKKEQGAVSIQFRVNKAPNQEVHLRMDCGWPCTGSLEVSEIFNEVHNGGWLEMSVPLACFESAGADLGKITTPFLLATSGTMSLDIAEVRVTENPREDSLLGCNDFLNSQ